MSLLESLGESFNYWSVWLLLIPIMFNKIQLKPMNGSELSHYLFYLFKLAIVFCSISIVAKLLFDNISTSKDLIANTFNYLPYELKVFLIVCLFAHVFKFHWSKFNLETHSELKEQEQKNKQENPQTDLLSVTKGHQQLLLRKEDINWVVACGNYAEIYSGGEHYLLRTTMKQLELKLGNIDFVRIHRSYIVNRNSIHEVKYHNNQNILKTICGEQLPLGKTYLDKITSLEQTRWH